jgi:hypothetical protein
MDLTRIKRLLIAGLLATLTITAIITTAPLARAAIPGQPGGIPTDTNPEGWRLRQGNICFEDYTGNPNWATAIQYVATNYSQSSDINVSYRRKLTATDTPCEAAGFDNATKITFLLRSDEPCIDWAGQARIWTEGGYLVPNYLITRAIVDINVNCHHWWTYPQPDQVWNNQRMVLAHEAGHVFGFAHQQFPVCSPSAPESWKCRPDTIMAADSRYTWSLTTWDYWRLDRIHPW